MPTVTGESGDPMAGDEYNLELYKSLRQEATAYLDKIPAIWLQKFLFAGAVLAFVVAKPDELPAVAAQSDVLIIAGFVCVPVLSLLLDVKILEYSLHARAISRFIMTQFGHISKVAAWEETLWGGGPEREVANLTRYRSAATVAVTLLSTAVLIVLSGIVVGALTQAMATVLLIAAITAAAYVTVGMWSVIVIWPRLASWKRHTAPTK
jgi:hypothetical protein